MLRVTRCHGSCGISRYACGGGTNKHVGTINTAINSITTKLECNARCKASRIPSPSAMVAPVPFRRPRSCSGVIGWPLIECARPYVSTAPSTAAPSVLPRLREKTFDAVALPFRRVGKQVHDRRLRHLRSESGDVALEEIFTLDDGHAHALIWPIINSSESD